MQWMMTKAERDSIQRTAIFLVALMFIQVALPLNAEGQTNPPSGPGDWTISSNDVTYFNNSQTVVQGDVEVYGTLVLESSNLFVWGSNTQDLRIDILDGGAH